MDKQLIRDFQEPGCEYRGKPFWAWNGLLEERELRRQIRVMKEMGLGGFFMHSRVGLATPYLSEKWFGMVAACADEAAKQHMEAWLYDEDRWPSGAAGGLVTKNPRYRMKTLDAEVSSTVSGFRWDASVVAAFVARVDGDCVYDGAQLKRGEKPKLEPGRSLVVFRRREAPCSDWYNGYSYLDTLSVAAVRQFIRVTHEAYARRFRKQFGKVIPGIFTDEPNYLDGPGLPWTNEFPRVFKKRYGYDIIPKLLEVFFRVDGKDVSQARWHYVDCATFMYAEAFSRQIGEWCGKHKLLFTGHELSEETPFSQTLRVGSVMRQLEHFQAPGMDLLTEFSRQYDTAKLVASAARQMGRRWRLTETYGCTGWDFNFAGHKALGDWQAALGINLRCQHLTWYTMEGEAKRDYPACIGYQSPWWQAYGKVEDYFARVGAVMTRGEEVRDLLVIYPVESVWARLHAPWDWGKAALFEDLHRNLFSIRDALLGAHIDYDYGDEDILRRRGRALAGKQPELRVGRARYKAVLVPPMTTIRSSTLALLRRFAELGGVVVFAGEPPPYVDAVSSEEAALLAARCAKVGLNTGEITAALAPVAKRISICDERGTEIPSALYLLREDRENFYLFVCNTGLRPEQMKPDISDVPVRERTSGYEQVYITGFADCGGKPQEWDPQTGEIYEASAERGTGGVWRISLELPELASRIFTVPKRKSSGSLPRRVLLRTASAHSLDEPVSVELTEENVLVLDFVEFRVGAGAWQKRMEVLKADRAIRDIIGLRHRGGSMRQPWARLPEQERKHAPVELLCRFRMDSVPAGPVSLALERPERFEISVNGNRIAEYIDAGWWTDRSLRRLPIAHSWLKPGENVVSLKCDYDADSGLEIMYLLGNFGVSFESGRPFVAGPMAKLGLGELGRQGLPFYSGNVVYRYRFQFARPEGGRVFLRPADYLGTAVDAAMDGKRVGTAAWPPNELEVTCWADGAQHELCLTLLGHRRNSHGPLHNTQKPMPWVGPAQFVTDGELWTDDYVLVPFGLISAPELLVKFPA